MIQNTLRKSAQDYFNQSEALIDQSLWSQSLANLEKAISIKPDYDDAYQRKGLCLFHLDRQLDSLQCFEKVISINPNHLDAHYCKGYILNRLERYQESIKCLNKALAIKPNDHEVYLQKGIAYENLKQYSNALNCYDKALLIDSNYQHAYLYKGITLNLLKRYQQALFCFEMALQIVSDDNQVFLNMGITFYHLESYYRALDCFEKAISLFSNNSCTHLNKALALNKLQKYQQALSSCDQALQINPKYALAHFTKGFSLQNLQQYNDALISYNKAISIDSNYIEALLNKGKTLKLLLRYKDSLKSFNQVLSINKSHLEAYLEKGYIYNNLEQYENALKCYEKALSIDPKNKTAIQHKYNLLSIKKDDGKKIQSKEETNTQKTEEKPSNALSNIKQEKVFQSFCNKLTYQRIRYLQDNEKGKYLHFQSVFFRLYYFFQACISLEIEFGQGQVNTIDLDQVGNISNSFKTQFVYSNHISFIPEIFQKTFELLNQFKSYLQQNNGIIEPQMILFTSIIYSKFENYQQMELEIQKSTIKYSEELPNEFEIISYQEEVEYISGIESSYMNFAKNPYWKKGIENTLIILKYLLLHSYDIRQNKNLFFRDALDNAFGIDENQLNAQIQNAKNDIGLSI